MNEHKFVSPFSSVTVVLAENYVNTFPNPHGFISYFHKLSVQLDVDIVSQDRHVTVKGSWKTIIKIDAFLRTLISSLHGTFSKGDMLCEEDFNSVFAHFKEEDNHLTDSLTDKNDSERYLVSDELSDHRVNDYLAGVKVDEENADPAVLDKWYFNSNPRGKTADRRKRRFPSFEAKPPDPYVIVEAGGSNKPHQANLDEIERVLSQVYKRETIEKYHKKYRVNENPAPPTEEVSSARQEDIHVCSSEEGAHVAEAISELFNLKPKMLVKNSSSHFLRSKNKKLLEWESRGRENKSAKKSFSFSSQFSAKSSQVNHSVPQKLQQTTRQHKITENIDNSFKNHKRHVEIRTCNKNKNAKTNTEEMPFLENHKAFKADANTKEIMHNNNVTNVEHNKEETEDSFNKLNRKIKLKLIQLKKEIETDKLSIVETNTTRQTRLKTSKFKDKINKGKFHISSFTTRKTCGKGAIDIQPASDKTQDKSVLNGHQASDKTQDKGADVQQVDDKDLMNVCSTSAVDVPQETIKAACNFKYSCDLCLYFTSKRLQLLEHTKRVHLKKKFKCEECQKEFGFGKDLKRHLKCHKKAEICCDVCGKMYKEFKKLEEHKRTHSDDYVKPEFPCKFCTKLFSTKYVLAYHIKSHHLGVKRSYLCPTCGKSFSQKNSYLLHANVHLGIKPFTCDMCGRKFSYEKSLREHTFTHKEEKKFSCRFCPKLFRQASGLAIHVKVHNTSKDYICSMCGKSFNQKQALVRHERIHKGEKPYECRLCNTSFTDSSVLRRHMILLHKKDPKQWQQDTLCHIKRSNNFINVLNGDNHCSKESENHGKAHLSLQFETQSRLKVLKPVVFDEDQRPCHPEVDGQQKSLPSINLCNNPCGVEKNSHIFYSDNYFPNPGSKTGSICPDVKPCLDIGSAENIVPSRNMNPTPMVESEVKAVVFPLPLDVACTNSQEMLDSTILLTPNIRHISHCQPPTGIQQQSSLATRAHSPTAADLSSIQNTSLYVYQQGSISCDTHLQHVEMQPLEFSSMVPPPFTQTIVVLQNNLEPTTYHQQGVSYSRPSAPQMANHQHPSPTLSSSTLSQVIHLSQVTSSPPLESIYDHAISSGHQHTK